MCEDSAIASTSGVGNVNKTRISYHNPSTRSFNALPCTNTSKRTLNKSNFRRNQQNDPKLSNSFLPFSSHPNKNSAASYTYRNRNTQGHLRSSFANDQKKEMNSEMKTNKHKTRLGYKKLEELSKEQDALKVSVELANTFNGLEYLLADEDFLREKPDWIILISQLLAKVCRCEFPENKINVLNVVFESQFIDTIIHCLHKMSNDSDKERIETFLNNTHTLIETLVDTFPNISKHKLHAPVKQIYGYISCIQEFSDFQIDTLIKTNFTKLESRLREMQEAYTSMFQKSHLDKGEPPENFRSYVLYPCEDDIFLNKHVFLRRNIVSGKYQSVEHYLDIQFRLLREDLLIPLREGFDELLHQLSRVTIDKDAKIKVNHLRYFEHCCLKTITTKHGTVSYDMCFDVDRKLNHINWEYNQWFKYGSLVFISFDNFSSFIVGRVANKCNQLFETERIISVELVGDKEIHVDDLDKNFAMVESKIFFNPYYHVMKALKQFNEKNFPLSRYIIEVNHIAHPPTYLLQNSYKEIYGTEIDVLDEHSWPPAEKLSFNVQQYQAFKSALTEEFVIIQGPPGTGKTYVGLKIVETLLKYKRSETENLHNAPILIVCYTNHALDQFLEGILKFTKNVVRVGSMTRSTVMKQYELGQKRMKNSTEPDDGLRSAFLTLRNEMRDIFKEIHVKEFLLRQIDHTKGIIHFHHLAPFMSPSHKNEIGSSEKLVKWLLMTNNIKIPRIETQMNYSYSNTEKIDLDYDDEDEVRRECQNDEKIVLLLDNYVKSLEDENPEIIHAVDFDSFETQKEELLKLCDKLEKSHDLQSNEYASKRWKYESEINSISLAMDNFSQQFKKVSFKMNAENLSNSSIKLKRLGFDERWKLYSKWVGNFKRLLMKSMQMSEKKFRNKSEQLDEARQLEDLNVLRKCDIVGITTTAAANKHLLLTNLKPAIVIVEEAAEVLEAHIVTSLTEHCQHLILIGDHQQLRPNPTVYKLAQQYHLDISLFERMIRNRLPFSTLCIQHRMRPEICDLISPAIYPHLENHSSVYNFDDVKGISKNLFFLTHEIEELMDNTIQSYKNPHEADFILQLVQYLLLQGYSSGEVTILTTYSGQLIYFKTEQKKMPLLKDVRISTVDNYQGEECDIIVLSLVRSNTNEKIGFLKISNRVCVALSRARKGLYLIGNMKALVESSDIWKPIKNKLEEHHSIGPELELKCLIHGNKTLVKEKEDFKSVAEGGCSTVCNYNLNCGHNCLMFCHPYDLEHVKYSCQKTCTKSCEEGHPCKYQCYQCSESCKPCRVQLNKFQLQCGHVKDIQCSQIKTYSCNEEIEIKIELCDHDAVVTCSAVTSGHIVCPKPCNIRLQCGHQCTLTCHTDKDPDHLEFICGKKCARLKRGCSQEHYCDKNCSESCPVCNENVLKKLVCGHEQMVPCHLDAIECLNPCEKILQCGHKCRKLCKDKCGDCNVLVEKEIQECGHTVQIKCKIDPTIQICRNPCQKIMSCGHLCPNKCNEACSSSDECTVLVVHQNIASLCEHGDVQVPCNYIKLPKDSLQNLALKYCTHSCGETLLCGHTCKGTCSECQQSRMHKICIEKCERMLLCGHRCRHSCSSTCPPCQARCLTKCPHKECKRSCAEQCDPCYAECEWKCKHQKCRLRCSEPCQRRRCYHACQEKLKCGHMCIGFCSEPCPDKCRVCDVDDLESSLFGSENKRDARFVVLEDCGHFFESNGIEKYLDVRTSTSKKKFTEIKMKTCPKCETPIISTLRFMNTIKFIKRNLKAAESFHRRSMQEKPIVTQKMDLICRIRKLRSDGLMKGLTPAGSTHMRTIQESILNQLEDFTSIMAITVRCKNTRKFNFMSVEELRSLRFVVDCMESLETGFAELRDRALPGVFKALLVEQADKILEDTMNIENNRISQQLKFDFFCEIDRFYALLNLVLLRMNYGDLVGSQNETTLVQMWNDSREIIGTKRFNTQMSAHFGKLLQNYQQLILSETPSGSSNGVAMAALKKPDPALWQDDQNMRGRVFKCSSGHMFQVTETQGDDFMCPECRDEPEQPAIRGRSRRNNPGPRASGLTRNGRVSPARDPGLTRHHQSGPNYGSRQVPPHRPFMNRVPPRSWF